MISSDYPITPRGGLLKRIVVVLLFLLLVIAQGSAGAATLPSISGRVVDAETGKGVADVEVLAYLGTWEFRAVTANDGRYTVPGLKPGTYQLRFLPMSTPHVQPVKTQMEVAVRTGKSGVAPDFLLPRASTLSGTVFSEKKGVTRPLPNATVEFNIADPRPEWGVRVGNARTGYHGEFAFNGLPAASDCLITVKVSGHADLRKTVSLEPGKNIGELRFIVSWDDPTGIAGAVRNGTDGGTLADVSILVRNGLGEIVGRASSDDYGDYSVVGLPPGSYSAAAYWQGADPLVLPAAVEAGKTTTVIFEYGKAGASAP